MHAPWSVPDGRPAHRRVRSDPTTVDVAQRMRNRRVVAVMERERVGLSPRRQRDVYWLVFLGAVLLLYINMQASLVNEETSVVRENPGIKRSQFVPPPPPPSAPIVRLPRDVPCIELSALTRCLHLHNPWPNSSDWACLERGVKQLDTCPTTIAGGPPVDWSAVVFGVPIHNSKSEADMLAAASETWLKLVAGADVLLTTDVDDPRGDDEIGRLVHVTGVTMHVSRCPVCCSGGMATPGRSSAPPASNADGTGHKPKCVGVREGWAARNKVLHMFTTMHTLFGGGGGGAMDPRKLFFFKMDADTLFHPHHLMPLLSALGPLARSPEEPLLLGLASCRSEHAPDLCHAAGGAGYALTPASLSAIARFVGGLAVALMPYGEPRLDAQWLRHLDLLTYGGEDVAVALALKQTSGASVINIGGFHQHPPEKYHYYSMDGVLWPTVSPLSFHNMRAASVMRDLFRCTFYEDEHASHAVPLAQLRRDRAHPEAAQHAANASAGMRPRCFVPSANAYMPSRHCPPFIPADGPTCVETPPNRTVVNEHSVSGRDRAKLTARQRQLIATGRRSG